MTLNRMKRNALRVAAAIAMTGSAYAAGGAPKEAGIWYDDTGKGAVKVDLCGDKLCGHIYWLKDPLNAEGKPLRDKHNPNESQQTRPICGLQVIGGLAHMEDGEWDTGWIYDPKEGKSYSVALTMADPNTLKVTGYLVMKMMGRTLTWTRAPADLPSCATNAAAAPAAAGGAATAQKVKSATAPSKVAAPVPSEQDEVSPPAPPAATTSKATAQPAEDVQVKPVPKAASVPAQSPPAATAKAAAPKPKPDAAKASTTAAAPSAAKAAPAKAAAKSDGKAAPDSKPAVKTAAKSPPPAAGATASGAKTTTKTAATKPAGAKGKEEALPWTTSKKAPAEGTTPTAEATNVTPVKAPRPATPDQQARPFGTE